MWTVLRPRFTIPAMKLVRINDVSGCAKATSTELVILRPTNTFVFRNLVSQLGFGTYTDIHYSKCSRNLCKRLSNNRGKPCPQLLNGMKESMLQVKGGEICKAHVPLA